MKKILTAIVLLIASVTSIQAQKKGDIFISGALSADLGFNYQRASRGNYSEKIEGVYDPSASIDFEFGYFPVNNLKIALCLGYGINADRSIVSGVKYTDLSNMFFINPNIAYYVKLANRFYYAPEIGFVYGIGAMSVATSESGRYKYGSSMYSPYIQPINFEFRINDHWAIGTGFGELIFACHVLDDKSLNTKLATNAFSLDLSSTVWARYYF